MSSVHDANLAALKAEFGLINFVETGTHLGDSVQAALDCGFEQVYSCDLMPHVTQAAQQRFAKQRNVTLMCADSLTFLRKTVPQLCGPTFFWLDAHFPEFYGYDASPVHRFPLAEELRIIGGRGDDAGDVIACDDIRVVADAANPTYVPGAIESTPYAALVIRDITIAQLAQPLVWSHTYRFLHAAEGILLFVPQRVGADAASSAIRRVSAR